MDHMHRPLNKTAQIRHRYIEVYTDLINLNLHTNPKQ